MESDLAEISELVILFSESYGSAAELGAFTVIKEISSRLLVVIDDSNYNRGSFVRYGPLLFLENTYGASSVFVLDRVEFGFSRIGDVRTLVVPNFAVAIEEALAVRLKTLREPTRFDPSRNGHVIKLITGLIQHFGALTSDEVLAELARIDISKNKDEIEEYLKCAEIAKWVREFRSGFTTYYVATAERDALSYRFRPGVRPVDKRRWRADVLTFWSVRDPRRHGTILTVRGGRL
jgi:hypothetical protein